MEKQEDSIDKNKDIVCENDKTQEEVDKIFANADDLMDSQKIQVHDFKTKYHEPLEHKVYKYFKRVAICFCIFIIIFALCGIYIFKTMIPVIKENIKDQIVAAQSEYEQISNENLTLEEKYQKEMIMSLQEKDIENIINNIKFQEILQQAVSGNKEIMIDFSDYLPEERKKQLEDIEKRYLEEKQALETNQKQENEGSATEANQNTIQDPHETNNLEITESTVVSTESTVAATESN